MCCVCLIELVIFRFGRLFQWGETSCQLVTLSSTVSDGLGHTLTLKQPTTILRLQLVLSQDFLLLISNSSVP